MAPPTCTRRQARLTRIRANVRPGECVVRPGSDSVKQHSNTHRLLGPQSSKSTDSNPGRPVRNSPARQFWAEVRTVQQRPDVRNGPRLGAGILFSREAQVDYLA